MADDEKAPPPGEAGKAQEDQRLTPELQRLVEEHVDLVPMIAREMAPKLARCFTYDDLLGLGQVGLVEAAGRADPLLYPNFEKQFRRFATLRIRGAMLDAYASQVADEERAAALCEAAVCDYLTRRAKVNVMADMDGRAEDRLLDYTGGVAACAFATDAGALKPRDAEQALDRLQASTSGRAALRRCVERLKGNDARVIEMRYFEGVSLSKIGQALKMPHPSAYRTHDRVVVQLHAMLAAEGVTEIPPREDEL